MFEPLSREDVPLGPFGGVELKLWRSRSGKIWHGDRTCRVLNDALREIVQTQPYSGTLADVAQPGGLHCAPDGTLATYLTAARALLKFDTETIRKAIRFAEGDFDLSIFSPSTLPEEHPTLTEASLLEVWQLCLSRRKQLTESILEEIPSRLPIIIAAAALRHQTASRVPYGRWEKYEDFLAAAEREFAPLNSDEWDAETAGRLISRSYVFTKYLKKIEEGIRPDKAIATLAEQQKNWVQRAAMNNVTSPPDEVHAIWLRIGEKWKAMLQGACAGHPGEVFAILHEDLLPFPAPIFHRLYPCARLRTTHFTWLAGNVPAVFRMMFRERNRGLLGLDLEREYTHLYTGDKPALFLQNLVTYHGMQKLAEHVETNAEETNREPVEVNTEDPHLHGFGEGFNDGGLARWQCFPALRAAKDGISFADEEDEEDPWDDDPDLEEAINQLLDRGDSATVLEAAQLQLRREKLAELKVLVESRSSSEGEVHQALKKLSWIFGGEYVNEAVRRRLTPGLELDIPLLRPDGVLHIVELKKPSLRIVKKHRSGFVAARAVHEGVGQVMNYMTLLDERRSELLDEFEIDTRRASATVVVGHPEFEENVSERTINETLRVLNSHLSRVEVISYKQLIDRAERNLDLTEHWTPDDSAQGPDPELGADDQA